MGRIIIIAGPPGAGKTTVAARLARLTDAPHSMHMHTDDMYGYVRRGVVPPWKPEADLQNAVLIHAMAASAAVCAKGGYEVYVDGVMGARFLSAWTDAAESQGLELRYVVLMPDEATTVARCAARTGPRAMTNVDVSRQLWRSFRDYDLPAEHLLDTSAQTADETVATVAAGLAEGRFRLA